jgi:hypothetical protein
MVGTGSNDGTVGISRIGKSLSADNIIKLLGRRNNVSKVVSGPSWTPWMAKPATPKTRWSLGPIGGGAGGGADGLERGWEDRNGVALSPTSGDTSNLATSVIVAELEA